MSTEPAHKFHDALTSARLEYAGLSWGGFNLYGTRRSIDEAKIALHSHDILPELRHEIIRLRETNEKLRAALLVARKWMPTSVEAAYTTSGQDDVLLVDAAIGPRP